MIPKNNPKESMSVNFLNKVYLIKPSHANMTDNIYCVHSNFDILAINLFKVLYHKFVCIHNFFP